MSPKQRVRKPHAPTQSSSTSHTFTMAKKNQIIEPANYLRKKEKKRIDKNRAMIEYHKCRVSNFSSWGKKASPEKLKHEAAVAALTAQIQLIELEAMRRDPLH